MSFLKGFAVNLFFPTPTLSLRNDFSKNMLILKSKSNFLRKFKSKKAYVYIVIPYRPFFRRPFFNAGPSNAGPNSAGFENEANAY